MNSDNHYYVVLCFWPAETHTSSWLRQIKDYLNDDDNDDIHEDDDNDDDENDNDDDNDDDGERKEKKERKNIIMRGEEEI